MKKTLLVLFCIIMSSVSAQIKEDQGRGEVITCSDFHVTLPLRDLVKLHPVEKDKNKDKKESGDRKYRPAQIFFYSAADGPEYGEDPSVRQTSMGTRSPSGKAPIKNWPGQAATGFRPTDPTGAAGPDHYIQAINGTPFKVYNKSTGAVLLTANIGSLWSPATANDGDPIIMYDKFANRWFLSQFDNTTGNNEIYIAISTSGDPTGTYYAYTFTSPQFPDYLKFSIWENGYYMTSNQSTDKVFCFERDRMLVGNSSARAISANFTTGSVSAFFVPLPGDAADCATLPTTGTPLPFFAYYDNGWGGGNDGVNIWTMTVNWGTTPTASITGPTLVQTSAFDASYNSSWNDVSQPGTTQKLDGIGGVPTFRAQWKNWSGYNTVVMNWGVLISSTQRSIRWVELRQNQTTGTWSLYQEGTYSPDAHTRWLGSIAMDNNGSIALAYCKSSSSIYPSLCYTGRLSSDPTGTMTFAETVAVSGSSSQTSGNRFGDYSHTSLDPDGVTFWHTGEYVASGVKSRIYSFQLPAGSLAPVANFSASPTTTSCSGLVQFTDQSSNTPTSWLWNFGDGQTSTSQNPSHTYASSGTYTVTLTATNSIGNNQLIRTNYVTINVPTAPTTSGGTICVSGSVSLTATGSGIIHWFDLSTGGTELDTGNTFTTPVISTTTTYYAEDHLVQASQYVGPTNNTSGGQYSTTSYTLTFDCLSPVTLVSVSVNAQTAGNRIINLTTSGGTILQTGTFAVPAGVSRITLNWPIAVGTGLKLVAPSNSGFYRINTAGTFPYTLAGLLSITGCSSTSRYGSFFDWEIKPPDCIGSRVPVVATVTTGIAPSVSVSASTNTICTGTNVTFTATPTNGGVSPTYQWKLNGGNVGSNSPTYSNNTLANGNTVKCVMTSTLGCASPTSATSNTITMTVTGTLTPAITIAASASTICLGTNVTFTATPVNGGITPSYQWKLNGGNVGSNSPTYSNNALANGNTVSCVLSSSLTCANPTSANSSPITMNVNSSVTPSVLITSAPSGSVCPGTSLLFTANPSNGGSSPAYQWTVDGINAGNGSTLSGVYNNGQIIGCTMTSAATCASPTTAVATPKTVDLYTVSPVTVVDNGGILTSSATNGNQWYELTSGIIAGATMQNYTYTADGNYYSIVTDAHGCTSTSNLINVTYVGIEANGLNSGISIFPNPTYDFVNIFFENAINNGSFYIENALGQKIFESNLMQTSHSIKVVDFRSFAAGVYFINIKAENTDFRHQVVFEGK